MSHTHAHTHTHTHTHILAGLTNTKRYTILAKVADIFHTDRRTDTRDEVDRYISSRMRVKKKRMSSSLVFISTDFD